MKRILLSAAVVLAVAAFVIIEGGASSSKGALGTYRVELDNAFGLVNGADFKVAGVRAGTLKAIELCFKNSAAHCQNPLNAVVTVDVTVPGFDAFHQDAFCQSRPQSLIGEYFIDCNPGSKSAPALTQGSTIPVTHTQSTIPADLVQNVMRLPYRQRLTLIINELGAAVAGRSTDLQVALKRAVPAITETDNLLNLLANDAQTLRDLNVNANQVITALADNTTAVTRFIDMAGRTATDTATQESAFQATWHKLPAFLEQLKPALAKLSTAADANTPVLVNLNAAAGQLRRFFTDLVPFSNASGPSLRSLGSASVTGKTAVQAAGPLVAHLNTFAKPTPELAQNLAIVLHDLDDRSRAVEPDKRSPGGRGFTGLEALLQYVFNQTLAINYFGPFGHMLAVDAFVSSKCSPYATAASIASGLAASGAAYRQCYAWTGPSQPGINEADPSNPKACVPDPGGEPPYAPAGAHPTGPKAPCKLAADTSKKAAKASASAGATPAAYSAPVAAKRRSGKQPAAATTGRGAQPGGINSTINNTISQILNLVGNIGKGVGSTTGAATGATKNTSGQTTDQAQQLLSYLLAP